MQKNTYEKTSQCSGDPLTVKFQLDVHVYVHQVPECQEEKPREVQDIVPEPEDVTSLDTSFFGTDRFPADVCEKNLREAIDGASGKADACRRIMLADTCGYIHIRQYTDARKAELINPFSEPKYKFYDYDFRQARNRK